MIKAGSAPGSTSAPRESPKKSGAAKVSLRSHEADQGMARWLQARFLVGSVTHSADPFGRMSLTHRSPVATSTNSRIAKVGISMATRMRSFVRPMLTNPFLRISRRNLYFDGAAVVIVQISRHRRCRTCERAICRTERMSFEQMSETAHG